MTNSAKKYYCHGCDAHFNPEAWCCPWCGDDTDVTKNPLDDYSEYYCYACNGAFNRLGPSFDPGEIEYNVLDDGFEDPEKQLSLSLEKLETVSSETFQFTLQNTGEEPIVVREQSPIALQNLQIEEDWWTIFGDPDRYTPTERRTLEPVESIEWEVEIYWKRTRGPGFEIHQKLLSGTYRLVYWGVPDSNTDLAVKFDVSV